MSVTCLRAQKFTIQLSGVISQLTLKQPQQAIVPFKNSPFSKGFQLYNRKLRHSEPSLADCQAQLPQWNCSNLCTSLGTSRQDINHIQSSSSSLLSFENSLLKIPTHHYYTYSETIANVCLLPFWLSRLLFLTLRT